jgi:regulator of sigma E protease
MDFGYILSIILLALGFGFVIFWHELGHFIAAKWAGVKVEQFAVGFGQALLSWRKGLGWRVGSSRLEYERRAREYLRGVEGGQKTDATIAEARNEDQKLDYAAAALGIGETEYRLNWLPLGGYVKMLGQDDLHPNAEVTDPRAYNMQSISKRMVIVSAGVIMNILLAAIGFCVLFLHGFNAPAAVVGSIAPMSPAQKAGLNVGDKILFIDGQRQHDFTKIFLTVALLPDGRDVPIVFKTPEGKEVSTTVRAARAEGDPRGMLQLGIGPGIQLRTLDPDDKRVKQLDIDPQRLPPEFNLFHPGDVIKAVGDVKIDDPRTQQFILDRALQQSDGKPIMLTVADASGATRQVKVQPTLSGVFGDKTLDIAGMVPRAVVADVQENSSANGLLKPDDIILSVRNVDTGDTTQNPSSSILSDRLNQAGQGERAVKLTVLRDGQVKDDLPEVKPTTNLGGGRVGLGVHLSYDEEHAVIGAIEDDSPAHRAGVPQGATVVSVDGKPVQSWYDVLRDLRAAKPDVPVKLVLRPADGAAEVTVELPLAASDIERARAYRYVFAPLASGLFQERTEPRQTNNPLTAAAWGAGETRDLIVQFYLTLKRMAQRSVPASNLMGPYGIVKAGSQFAYRGTDWLIWFLSMISANLAVVNFLPIPIVDGGLFLFLIIEKLQGKPISARAQSIAQVVGLALILSVFIFVTYQDIVR